MSTTLATAANLATDVAAWLARADQTADIPTMIILAEAKFNRLLRSLEHETVNPAFPLTGEYVPVPADFLEFKSGYIVGNPKIPLQYLPGDSMNATTTPTTAYTSVQYFTQEGTNFRFSPVPSGSVAHIAYFTKLPTLSGVGAAYNWLLQQHPDAYLYGTLLEASGRVHDLQQVKGWQSAYSAAIQQITDADMRKRYGCNGMAVRCA